MKKPSAFSIVLWVALAGLIVTAALLAPGTLNSYQRMQTEQNATPTPTADNRSVLLITIDPNNTPTPTPLILKNGSQGDEVSRLQQRLKELGFYAGEMDGQYGAGTAEAVKLFQSQHGIDSDGLAGDATRNLLFSQAVQTYIPTPTPSPTPSVLQKGDRNDAVRSLQQRLKDLGFLGSSVDGDYGGGTQEAVKLFQTQHGLEADGIAAQQTMALLFSEGAKQAAATPTPDPNASPILVNSAHPVPENYQPSDLVLLKNVLPSSLVKVKGSEIEGNREAVAALQTMLEAAHRDGVDNWQISAGYRSVGYQQKLFDQQVKEYMDQGKSRSNAVSATRLTVADPGASEHHTGFAFDITVPGVSFKGTEQQIWLHKNCWEYGFIIRYQEEKEKMTGIVAEAWHIRYVGVQHSTVMRDKGLCLEEYLGAVES